MPRLCDQYGALHSSWMKLQSGLLSEAYRAVFFYQQQYCPCMLTSDLINSGKGCVPAIYGFPDKLLRRFKISP